MKKTKITSLSKAKTLLDVLNYCACNNIGDIEEHNGEFSTEYPIVINDYIDSHLLDKTDKSFTIPISNVVSLLFDKSDVSGIPLKCSIEEDLEFRFCDNLKHLDCKNIELRSKILSVLQFYHCKNLKLVNNIVAETTLKILFYKCAIQNLQVLNEHQEVAVLCISDCDFRNLSGIRNGIYSLFQLLDTPVDSFSAHNAAEIQRCEFDCNYIKSFRNVDDFMVTSRFRLSNIDEHCHNIINILNNKCDNIIIDPDSTASTRDVDAMKAIIRKYLQMKNSSNYLMDCAVELLDLGYNTAAEL